MPGVEARARLALHLHQLEVVDEHLIVGRRRRIRQVLHLRREAGVYEDFPEVALAHVVQRRPPARRRRVRRYLDHGRSIEIARVENRAVDQPAALLYDARRV